MVIESTHEPMLPDVKDMALRMLEALPTPEDTFELLPDDEQTLEDYRQEVQYLLGIVFPAYGVRELANDYLGDSPDDGRRVRYKVREEGYLNLVLKKDSACFTQISEEEAMEGLV